MTYLTLEDHIKPYLGIEATDSTEDFVLELLNKASCSMLNNILNIDSFTRTTYTDERVDGGASEIYVRNFPVLSVSTIKQGSSNTLYNQTSPYILERNKILLDGVVGGGIGYEQCKVTYTAGYVTQAMYDDDNSLTINLPDDIVLANLIILAGQYNAKNNIGVSSYSINGRSVNFRSESDAKQFESLIQPYKKVSTFAT